MNNLINIVRLRCNGAKSLLLALPMLLFVGCDPTMVVRPLGEAVAEETLLPLRGKWRGYDCDFQVEVTTDGLVCGKLQFDVKRQAFEAINHKVVVTKLGNHRLVFGNNLNSEYYNFFLVEELAKSRFTIRAPDLSAFTAAVTAGKLDGEVLPAIADLTKDWRLLIKADAAQFEKAMETVSLEELFPKRRRVTYYRDKPPEEGASR